MANYGDITLALAGVCQACQLVPALANTGSCSPAEYGNAVNSILNQHPTSTLDVFGNLANLHEGLRVLTTVVGHAERDDLLQIRYVFSCLSLGDKLRHHPDILTQIGARLSHVSQYQHYSPENDEAITTSLGGIYTDLISPLGAKIKVTGQVLHLQNTYIQAKIRTALFAGIRASILWRQVGGTRLNLFFGRKKILSIAEELLHSR